MQRFLSYFHGKNRCATFLEFDFTENSWNRNIPTSFGCFHGKILKIKLSVHCVVISDIFRQIELQFTIWFFSEKIIWRNFRKKKCGERNCKLPLCGGDAIILSKIDFTEIFVKLNLATFLKLLCFHEKILEIVIKEKWIDETSHVCNS